MKGIRATEVRNYIKAHGEQGMITCIEQIYERQAALEQSVQENGMILLQMSKMMAQIVDGAGAMRSKIEQMQGKDDDDDLPMAHDGR